VRWGKLADVIATRGDLVAAYQVHYGLFAREFYETLLDAPQEGVDYGLGGDDLEHLRARVRTEPLLHAVSILELNSFVGNRLLRDCDAASMAVSLELRVPLLDHRVIEIAAAVQERQRFHPLGRKQLLKDLALTDLDPSLFARPKAGFVLPISSWLLRELGEDVSATFRDHDLSKRAGLRPEAVAALWEAFQARAPGIYWSRVWSLYVLLWWCRLHEMSV
jgi:asparagine synthase (glutamine-hydrolysing)